MTSMWDVLHICMKSKVGRVISSPLQINLALSMRLHCKFTTQLYLHLLFGTLFAYLYELEPRIT